MGVVGVVLAGGLSSRMGTDKARLRLCAPSEPDLLTRTALLLRTCTAEVAVSCRAATQTAPQASSPPSRQTANQIATDAHPWRRILDEQEGGGPVGALCSVLRAEPRPVLVLPCDLPFMTEQVLCRLLTAHAARPPDAVMTTFRQLETGRIEPLVAVYEPACRPWFEAAVAAGNRRLNAVVPERLRYCVPYGEDEALPFFNLNSPADLEAARRLAARQAHGAARA